MKKARIEIRSRDIDNLPYSFIVNKPINVDALLDVNINFDTPKPPYGYNSEGRIQHLFIIYTDSQGQETLLRGGPERSGSKVVKDMLTKDLKVTYSAYKDGSEDWVTHDVPSVVIAQGTDAQMQALIDKMWQRGQEINAGNFDYKLPTPGCPAALCHVQNSNTVVRALVESAGLKFELPQINGVPVSAPGAEGTFKHTLTDQIIQREQTGLDRISDLLDELKLDFSRLPDSIHSLFVMARALVRRDPLTLDLDGDGLETLGLQDTPTVLFDHDGDGIKTKSGWVKPDDGFLVLDRNNNSRIDHGQELFGDATPKKNGTRALDGFDALADLDENDDHVVDARDAQFANLYVWRDLNSDGVSQTNELFTLAQIGIQSFHTAKTAKNRVLENGNRIADLGYYTRVDGSTANMGDIKGEMADIDLSEDAFHRHFIDRIPIPDALKHLPHLQGTGAVRDLREAAALSPELATCLHTFISATTRDEQRSQLKALITAWAKSASHFQTSQVAAQAMGKSVTFEFGNEKVTWNGQSWSGAIAWLDLLSPIETFNGAQFVNSGEKEKSTRSARVSHADKKITVYINSEQINTLKASWHDLENAVYGNLVMQTRLRPYLDLVASKVGQDGLPLGAQALKNKIEQGMIENPRVTLIDLIELAQYAYLHLGHMGFDVLGTLSRYMDDPAWSLFIKETGAQLLGAWKQGGWTSGTAIVHFLLGGRGKDSLNGGRDKDILLGGLHDDELSGGRGDDILMGGRGNDLLKGEEGHDVLDGGEGDDTLIDASGNNFLRGGAGNDTLEGHGTFEGGRGDDTLIAGNIYGENSADTYLFDLGDGKDSIVEQGSGSVKDKLKFGAGISPASVHLLRSTNDLIFKISDTDQVRARNWFLGPDHYIEEIQFADGTLWTLDTLCNRVITVIGSIGDDVFYSWGGKEAYPFNLGDGQDMVILRDASGSSKTHGALDILQFGPGITPASIQLLRADQNLIFQVNSLDQMTVKDWFLEPAYWVKEVQFADGTVWTLELLYTLIVTCIGSPEGDQLNGWSGRDKLIGNAGHDQLNGHGGEDIFDGGEGNDTLIGHGLFEGGRGNDILKASGPYWEHSGDTYLFNAGDGKDTIIEQGAHTYESRDTLRFGPGIRVDQLWFQRVDNSLEVSCIGTSDSVTIKGWYMGPDRHIEIFIAENRILRDSQVDLFVQAMSVFDLSPIEQTMLPLDCQEVVGPLIDANWEML